MKKKQNPRLNAGRKGAHTARPGPAKRLFPVVGIGASAGGLEAFSQLLHHLPVDSGMAFVLVQHLDPVHESSLTGILARTTSMPVREVTNNLVVQPNHVYVIPPNTSMAIAGGILKLRPRPRTTGPYRSIDFFFESLARDQGERAIGVILSGTASDGTLGAEAIKAEGGLTFAQDASAKYDSMPRSAIAAGFVDFVLSPEAIAKELARIAKHPYVAGQGSGVNQPASPEEERPSRPVGSLGFEEGEPAQPRPVEEDDGLRRIVVLLRDHSGVDFSLYKSGTIVRRIARRMVLNKLDRLEAYVNSLRGNSTELDALYSDVLINVTSFFRNPEVFETLKARVFPRLIRQRRDEPVRLWVLGCSTGQEAYSLAMAFTEFCEQARRGLKLQVFATDLSEAMLAKARAGLYAKSLVGDVSPERLRRFFVAEDGGYRIIKSLREVCIFARHNLLGDPPFSRVDLISCRNLLIYIEPALHKKILPMFHYALKPDGFLFLGASESIGSLGDLFEPVDKRHRIYAKRPGQTLPLGLRFVPRHPQPKGESPAAAKPAPVAEGGPDALSAQREADRVVLSQYAPPAVLIDAELQVLQFRGDTSSYLKPPRGKASFDVLKMAREGLLVPLRAALNQARKENKVVRRQRVPVTQNGASRTVNFKVIPLKNLRERCYLICFEDASQSEIRTQETPHPDKRVEGRGPRGGGKIPRLAAALRRIAELDRELSETRDFHQSLQEQHEAADEELQASNEEIQSANEELQSVNEELETSKEELESSNEELTTVNEEMANRNQELNRLNSDLNNLHVSINTPILVLGRDLTIRRFTPLAEKVFNLLATDVGRPLSRIKHNLVFPGLEEIITEAITTISPREREVQDQTGNWHMLRVRPYLTLDNKVDGAVLMLVDVNALKQTEARMREARDFAQAVTESVPPLLILEPDLRVRSANQSFCQAFGVTAEQAERRLVYELGNGQWNIPALRKLLEDILPRHSSFNQYELTHDFENTGWRTMLLSGCQVGGLGAIVLSIEDITDRKQAEEKLQQTTLELERSNRDLEQFASIASHDLQEPLRAVSGYLQLLQRRFPDNLDAKALEYLAGAVDGAGRMEKLIGDLLAYARVGTQGGAFAPADLGRLLSDALQCLQSSLQTVHATVTNDPLPRLSVDAIQVTQLFLNLLGNAIKYRSERPLRIHVGAKKEEGRWVFWVRDNGIGIDPQQFPRLFQVFQRLHTQKQYPGTGIGLAVCKRIAERHGGAIWIESQPDEGSGFYFSIPETACETAPGLQS